MSISEKAEPGRLEHSDGDGSDKQDPRLEAANKIDVNKTLRQMDYRVVPIVAVLYLLSFLDRGCAEPEVSLTALPPSR